MSSSGLKTKYPRGHEKKEKAEPSSEQIVVSEVHIEKLVPGGNGLARVGAQVVFVKGGLPGEQIHVQIGEKRRGVHYGDIRQILEPSQERVHPPCSIYGQCGGCQFQHLSYQGQLEQKKAILTDALQRIGKIELPEIGAVVPSPQPFGYRSTIRFVVFKGEKNFQLGFYQAETRNAVEAKRCLLISEPMQQLVAKVAERLASQSTVPMYLEHVEFRASTTSTDVLIVFHGSYKKAERVKEFLEPFQKFSGVVGCIAERSGPKAGRVPSTPLVVGKDYVTEKFDDLKVQIGHRSFSQTNWPVYESIGRQLREWLGELQGVRVLELYAGTGLLGMTLARNGAFVTLVESNAFALADARTSVALSRVARCRFKRKGGESFLPSVKQDEFDVVLVDPPRTGLTPQVTKELGRIKAPRVLYISCDVATLARDLARLGTFGYRVVRIQPFDMFPQTAHIETLVELAI